jgi:putative DNA methylase
LIDSDSIVEDVRKAVTKEASNLNFGADETPLRLGGSGGAAYADAVATYLAFAVSKSSTRSCSLAIWETGMGRLAGAMGRQGIPMQWSFAETNPLAGAGGDIAGAGATDLIELLNPNSGK